MAKSAYLSVDMGASSGRHVVGRFDGSKITLEEIYRFENGAVDVVMTRSSGGRGRARDEIDLSASEWAESYPPFRPDRARIAPTGELWVERWLHPDEPPRWDVFGEDGVRLGSVELPTYRRIVGWGTTADGDPSAYLAYVDEFDLKYLERYRLVR